MSAEVIMTKDKFIQACEKEGIHLNQKQIEQFDRYKDLLLEWNQKMNLTAIKEPKEIIVKHFLDSLSIQKYIKKEDVLLGTHPQITPKNYLWKTYCLSEFDVSTVCNVNGAEYSHFKVPSLSIDFKYLKRT